MQNINEDNVVYLEKQREQRQTIQSRKDILRLIGEKNQKFCKSNTMTNVWRLINHRIHSNHHLKQKLNHLKDKTKILILNDDIHIAKYLYQVLPWTRKQRVRVTQAQQLFANISVLQTHLILVLDDVTLEHGYEVISSWFEQFPFLQQSLFLIFTDEPDNHRIRLLKSETQVGIMNKLFVPTQINRDFFYYWHNYIKKIAEINRELIHQSIVFPHVLLIEENNDNRYAAERLLKQLGCHVDAVANGQQALEYVQKSHDLYDLVILDIGLSDTQGFEIAELIKKLLPVNYDLPMIAVSAQTSKINPEKCFQAGISQLIHKPRLLQDFRALLQQHIPAAS